MSEDDNIKTLVAGYRERPDAHRALSQISARAATLALRQLEVTNFNNNVEEKNKLISRAHQILRKICSNPLFSPSPLFNLASSTSPNDSSSSAAAAAAAAAAATATNIESSVRSLDDDDDDDLGGGWDDEEESGGGGGGGGGGGRGEGGRDNDKERESNGYQRQRQHDHTFQLSTPKSIEALRSSLAGANSVVEYKAVSFIKFFFFFPPHFFSPLSSLF